MMEYLVSMSTHVRMERPRGPFKTLRPRGPAFRPAGNGGPSLRLWHPPLKPGEWRTLGLFAADDNVELEEVLTSMPLRVWRTDQVTPLSPHPDDPARQSQKPATPAPGTGANEFLTTFTVTVPPNTAPDAVALAVGRRPIGRARAGPPGIPGATLDTARPGPRAGAVARRRPDRMDAILASLPLSPWMSVETTPLTPHPSDPAHTGD